ncbi:alpha/beta hydrolase [Bradyrhizobium sp. LA6.7]|uniref:alpha/beta hydrolase n=1 Tax=unclassified Bradyrhizobium TaxID=2631580 RepID=UPI00339A1D7E
MNPILKFAFGLAALVPTTLSLHAQDFISARHETFYVGGHYVTTPGGQVMRGQMFVEALIPEHPTHPYPLVMIHGLAQSGTNWMSTPDGRQGWAEWFVSHGWTVYMVDQPARGRSAWQPGLDGSVKPLPADAVEKLFTAPEDGGAWPQASRHNQWPGKGHAGDKVFDQFYSSLLPSLPSTEGAKLVQPAGAALLDRIGPAILLTHSQAGPYGWLIADSRPALVKGIVAMEPVGPPYKDAVYQTGSDRAWGLTTTPLTYDPSVTDASPLQFEQQTAPDAADLAPCWLQKGTPRRLTGLASIPVLVATGEASYHAVYDHCTARYLSQAGVNTDFVRLADHGMHGNGHQMMIELNNLDIAAFLNEWMVAHIH